MGAKEKGGIRGGRGREKGKYGGEGVGRELGRMLKLKVEEGLKHVSGMQLCVSSLRGWKCGIETVD